MEENKQPQTFEDTSENILGYYNIANMMAKKPSIDTNGVDKPGFFETYMATVRNDNEIINNVYKISNELQTLSEYFHVDAAKDFNATDWKYLSQAEPEDWPALVLSRTEGEFFRRLWRREDERRDIQISIDGSLGGNIAGILTNGITSPLNWLPIAAGVAAPTLLSSAWEGAKTVLPGVLVTSAIGEANLVWAKETRTVEEGIKNTFYSTLTGMFIGGIAGSLRSMRPDSYKATIEETVKGNEVRFALSKGNRQDFAPAGFNIHDDSAGAMAVKSKWLEDNQLLGFTRDGKYHPARPFFWMSGKWARNPIVLGATSPSPTVSKFVNDAYTHNFDTVGTVKKLQNRTQSIQSRIERWDAQGMLAEIDVNNSYYEYLGLPHGQPIRNLGRKFFKNLDGKLKADDYMRELQIAWVEGKHEDPFILSQANKLYKKYGETVSEALVAEGMLAPNIKLKTAANHLQRIPDREYMIANEGKVRSFFESKYAETNERVIKERALEADLVERLAALERQIAGDFEGVSLKPEQKLFLEAQQQQLKMQLNNERARIRRKERQGKYSPDMLTGDAGWSIKENNELVRLRKPINKLKKEIKQLEQELSVVKRKGEDVAHLDVQINAKKAELEKLREAIHKGVEAQTVPQKFVFLHPNGKYYLKRPNYGALKLRPVLTKTQLEDAAYHTFQMYTGQSDYQLMNSIASGLKSGSTGADFLKPRTVMIPDIDLYKAKILSPNLGRNLRNFVNRAGTLIEVNKYLKSIGWDGKSDPSAWLAEGINIDYQQISRKIQLSYENRIKASNNPAEIAKLEKAQQAELLKLDRQKSSDINLVSDTLKRISKGYVKMDSHKGMIKTSRILNKYAYGTQLGALLFMSLSDAISPIFRAGPVNWIKETTIPFLLNVAKMNKGNNMRLRQAAADLGIGIELERAFLDQSIDAASGLELPLNWVERQAGNVANTMGILNGTSVFTDAVTRMNANGVASRLTRHAKEFLEGTLSKSERIQLATLGLADEKFAKYVVEQIKNGNVERLSGAYLPNISKWDNKEFAEMFRRAIHQEVRSTQFAGKNIASYPSGIDPNGLSSMFLIYMGWMFNATSNYMLPLMQRVDPARLTGAAAMISAGMLVKPLRKISRGEELTENDLEPFTLFKHGILDSGVGGIFVDTFNKANAVGQIFPSLLVDRYNGKAFELIAGVPGTLADVTLNLVGQAKNKEWNKSDLKRLARAMPLLNLFYLRKLVNDYVENLEIPKTRKAAQRANEYEE